MGNQTSIEINGKKYDAITGRIIQSTAQNHTTTEKIMPRENIGMVDGFSKRSPKSDIQRVAPANVNKSVQKSQTLMRNSVKKPDVISRVTPKQPHGSLKKKLGDSPVRSKRASEIHRSPQIQKFENPILRTSVVKSHSDLTVRNQPVVPENQSSNLNLPATTTTKVRSAAAEKLIEAALANADSHNQQPVHHKRKRKSKLARKLGISSKAIAISSAVLSAVLLAGFFAVQKVPNLAMGVAATRAGFDASLPSYQPSGFSFKGPINYSTGRVTVTFRSNSDSRTYDFTQRSSNWSSDALLANYIVEESKQYQTYLDRGRTLYIYDGSNATWVDDGVWYQIEGDSGMTTDQLIRIAASI